MIEELGFEDFKEPFSWSEILRRADFKFVEEFIDGNFFYRRSLLTFLLWFFGLLLWRMNRIRDVVFIRVSDPAEEVIEGTDTWRITNRKAGKDGIQAVLLKLRSPGSNGSNLKLHGKQVRSEQIGRKPRRWPVFGVTVLHDLIHRGEIKEPELFHDIPGGGVEGRISVRIVFTKLRQDTVLIGGMAAGVKWFHDVHLQSRAICFLIEGARLAVSGEIESSRRAAHFAPYVNPFNKKVH